MSDAIEPFEIHHPDEQLEDLRNRLRHTRWPDAETVSGTPEPWSQGMPLWYAQEVVRYWVEDYDWRICEAELNALPMFTTVIDDLRIQFIHLRSPNEDAQPLVVTHGWPGSIVEFLDVLGPLSDPAAHGGDAADAFHLVIPSLPGFGWSEKPTRSGWGVQRIAAAWEKLMLRLGYDRFGAQGGDWGSIITTALALAGGKHLSGFHVNMPIAPPDPETMDDMSDLEVSALAGLDHYLNYENGYSAQQSTRPQTLGYGLSDSPAAQMAWIVEKFWAWCDHDGDPRSAVRIDRQLDNVMTYWLTNSGASSARLYWESFKDVDLRAVGAPAAVSVFPEEIFRTSRRWAEKRYTDLRFFENVDAGGHFAALEQPELFVDQVRRAFAAMR